MARHLLLHLQAPLVAFGGEAIDSYGVIRDFPALSMVTGLLANALGWQRSDDTLHNRLQARLRLGCRIHDPRANRLRDFQTAEIKKDDQAWTTWGVSEKRRGGPDSYSGPHLRHRDYWADFDGVIVFRLDPSAESPTLDDIALALDRPARPLFLGRKPCLPSGRLFAGWIEAPDLASALAQVLPATLEGAREAKLQWPEGDGRLPSDRLLEICDERNWTTGVHGGWRPVREAWLNIASTREQESMIRETLP